MSLIMNMVSNIVNLVLALSNCRFEAGHADYYMLHSDS